MDILKRFAIYSFNREGNLVLAVKEITPTIRKLVEDLGGKNLLEVNRGDETYLYTTLSWKKYKDQTYRE
jgi:hypothetical protein